MKIKICIIGVICILFLPTALNAQKGQELYIHYTYSIVKNSSELKEIYPYGVGGYYSALLKNKVFFNSGLVFSLLYNKHNGHRSGQPSLITTTEFKGSIYSLFVGIHYPIIEKSISVKIGSNIISSYVHDRWDIVVYDTSKIYYKSYQERFGLGINANLKIEYSLSDKVLLFMQPGYTYYLFGDFKKNKIFNCHAGFVYKLNN